MLQIIPEHDRLLIAHAHFVYVTLKLHLVRAQEKVVLRKNKTQSDLIIENLSDLKNKSVENIRKTLEDRLTTNEGFTLAKNSLIHIESSNTKFSLLYKYIESVYKKLKTTKENQIIPLLGSSLKAKETTI